MATAVRLRIAFRLHLNFSSATNWWYMQKSCGCTWPQWQNSPWTIQGNFPRKSLATEAAYSLRLHLQNLLPLHLTINIEQLRPVPTLAMGTSLLNIYVFYKTTFGTFKMNFQNMNTWWKSMQCTHWAVYF
jgi:hypothetical protein